MKMKRKFSKKQKLWAVAGLVLVAVALVLFIVIGIPMIRDHKNSAYNSRYQYDGQSLIGKWQEKEDFNHGFYQIIDFQHNGKVVTTYYVYGIEAFSDIHSTYRTKDKNTLIITYGNDNVPQNFESSFSISSDKSTLVIRENNENLVLEPENLDYNKDTAIFGEWVITGDSSVVYTLSEDYTGKLSDSSGKNNIVYSTNDGTFYMFINENLSIEDYTLSEEFVIDYKYKIENDVLTLTDKDGNSDTYQRRK